LLGLKVSALIFFDRIFPKFSSQKLSEDNIYTNSREYGKIQAHIV
jgi:hypothetical protein